MTWNISIQVPNKFDSFVSRMVSCPFSSDYDKCIHIYLFLYFFLYLFIFMFTFTCSNLNYTNATCSFRPHPEVQHFTLFRWHIYRKYSVSLNFSRINFIDLHNAYWDIYSNRKTENRSYTGSVIRILVSVQFGLGHKQFNKTDFSQLISEPKNVCEMPYILSEFEKYCFLFVCSTYRSKTSRNAQPEYIWSNIYMIPLCVYVYITHSIHYPKNPLFIYIYLYYSFIVISFYSYILKYIFILYHMYFITTTM